VSQFIPEVVVLSFHGGQLVGGGRVYQLSTPGGTTYLLTVPRGQRPDLDGAFDDPTPDGIERVLRRNPDLQWARVERDGGVRWHPSESEARIELSESAVLVCYGARRVPGWLKELSGNARTEVVLRMATAAGLDVSTATFTTTSTLEAGPGDGSTWSASRHLGTGLQGIWLWSTHSWTRSLMAAALAIFALWAFAATVTAFDPSPLTLAPPGPPGVALPGSGLPPLELNPCDVLRDAGRPSTAAFCDQVVGTGAVDPDLWYIAGNLSREIRADRQSLNLLSDRTTDDVAAAWAPTVSALFGKLLLVAYMPAEWGVELTQPDSPYLGPTRPVGGSDQEFVQGFSALLAESPPWVALWAGVEDPPDPASLHREIFGRERTLAAHGELVMTVRH
jgi:hypothetical protein